MQEVTERSRLRAASGVGRLVIKESSDASPKAMAGVGNLRHSAGEGNVLRASDKEDAHSPSAQAYDSQRSTDVFHTSEEDLRWQEDLHMRGLPRASAGEVTNVEAFAPRDNTNDRLFLRDIEWRCFMGLCKPGLHTIQCRKQFLGPMATKPTSQGNPTGCASACNGALRTIGGGQNNRSRGSQRGRTGAVLRERRRKDQRGANTNPGKEN